MRKTEPLRNKVVFRVREQNGFEWEDYERNIDIEGMDKQILVRKFFYLHDVKQAVQGLLKETEARIPHKNCDCDICIKLNWVIDDIKKWFPDVIENE